MKLKNSIFDQPLVFVDIETTGLRPTYDRIIEIGILRVVDGQIVQKFNSLINPNLHLPPEIIQITGITSQELENAPSWRETQDEVLELLKDAIFVAHNARFDYGFVKNEFRRSNISFSTKPLCSAKLSRALFPRFKRHNLDVLIERFELDCTNRHRAFDDAHVIYQFFQKINEIVEVKKVLKVIDTQLKKASLPANLKPSDLENLPETPGVYIFYGASGAPLYVGKSVNIRDRVLSHFNSDHSNNKEMRISQQIESLETITTVGELGALLLESSLVKKLQPIYNRKLRHARGLITLKKQQDENGYFKVTLDSSPISPTDLSEILGIFRSVKQAKAFLVKLCKEHLLCEKLLGLEKTHNACFGYRLGRCKGGCVKEELAVMYNLRLIQAFAKTRVQSWPFSGPILLKEKNPLENSEEVFVIDQWCVVGSGKSGEEFSDLVVTDYNFDLDNYRIINSYLKSGKKYQVLNEDYKKYSQLSF